MRDMTRSLWRRLPGWVKGLSEIGGLPSDSEELRVRKAVLILSSMLMASLSFVWVATYAALGLWAFAAISVRLSSCFGGTSIGRSLGLAPKTVRNIHAFLHRALVDA